MLFPSRLRMWAALAGAWLLFAAPSLVAQEAAEAVYVTVPHPLTSEAVTRIENQVKARVNDATRPARTVVLDFNPGDKPASSTAFGPCSDLADFLRKPDIARVRTIAFVHAPTTGHAVLPVLACKEVVMGKAGVLGPILVEGVAALTNTHRVAYETAFAREDRWPIVQKMFDPAVSLVKGKDKATGNPRYADRNSEKAMEKVVGAAPVANVQDNQVTGYPADVARALELAVGLADSRRELADLYGLPPLREDPLQGRSPVAYQWTLRGDVDGAMRESVNRVIRDVRSPKKGGNVLILVLNCG
ncbi:MAG: hypothetical protein K2V38_21130, partial [Gemmataceae bacterium]|nr:hypothetical protein [Gemmataceae bacterium]